MKFILEFFGGIAFAACVIGFGFGVCDQVPTAVMGYSVLLAVPTLLAFVAGRCLK